MHWLVLDLCTEGFLESQGITINLSNSVTNINIINIIHSSVELETNNNYILDLFRVYYK